MNTEVPASCFPIILRQISEIKVLEADDAMLETHIPVALFYASASS